MSKQRTDFSNPFQELGAHLSKKKQQTDATVSTAKKKTQTRQLCKPLSADTRRQEGNVAPDDAELFLAAVANCEPFTGKSVKIAEPDMGELLRVAEAEKKSVKKTFSADDTSAVQQKKDKEVVSGALAVSESEGEFFIGAMQGVQPLDGKGRNIMPAVKAGRAVPEASLPKNALDYLQGNFEFSLEYTEEFFEGHVMGIDPMIIVKLRGGQYSPEAYIDLHGFNSEQAYASLLNFIRAAYNKGQRALVVVTGRGKNSPGGQAVLRKNMQDWLTKDPLKRVVLAFCTAQPRDGGAGALYVLLRKYKKSHGKIYWDKSPLEESPLI